MKNWNMVALFVFVVAVFVCGVVLGFVSVKKPRQTFAQEMCDYCIKEKIEGHRGASKLPVSFDTNCKLLCEVAAKEMPNGK